MRKFLMVAAVVAVAACGEKKTEGVDSVAAPVVDSMAKEKADSMISKADSMIKADTGMKHDSMAPAPKP